MEDICCLDREVLGRLAFWREFRLAAKEKGSIKILTHKKDLDALPIDLKLLLGKVGNDDKRVGAILGVSQSARRSKVQFASDTIGIMIIGLMTMFKIFLSRNQYRFRVLNNPDGTIDIRAYPRSA